MMTIVALSLMLLLFSNSAISQPAVKVARGKVISTDPPQKKMTHDDCDKLSGYMIILKVIDTNYCDLKVGDIVRFKDAAVSKCVKGVWNKKCDTCKVRRHIGVKRRFVDLENKKYIVKIH